MIAIPDKAGTIADGASPRSSPSPGRTLRVPIRAEAPLKPSESAVAAGFSLVELTVCCALLGVLTVLCVSSLQGTLPAARVGRAAKEVAALLEWARWSAVRNGCVFSVTVYPEEGMLRVFQETEKDAGGTDLAVVRHLDLPQDHSGVVFGTADGVVRTSGCKSVDPSGVHLQDRTIRFLPSGTADRCGSLYLIPEQDVPDRRDRMRAISILLSTGRLQTWTYNPHAESGCGSDGAWQPL